MSSRTLLLEFESKVAACWKICHEGTAQSPRTGEVGPLKSLYMELQVRVSNKPLGSHSRTCCCVQLRILACPNGSKQQQILVDILQ